MSIDPDEPALDETEPTATDEAPAEGTRARKPRPIDPAIVALFPPGTVVDHEFISATQRAWREATQREAPSIDRLAERGTIQRVDADLSSGYLAVVTADDTWRAFVPAAQLPAVLSLLLRTPLREVIDSLAPGPGTLVPMGRRLASTDDLAGDAGGDLTADAAAEDADETGGEEV